MSSFSQETFVKKLHDLNNSAPSIQTLSLWLIHHRKHARDVVKMWKKAIIRASSSQKKLTYMYLANDVIQNSKKKGSEFNQAFAGALADVYRHLGSRPLDEKTEKGIQRLLQVWGERGVFTAPQLSTFKAGYESGSPSAAVTMSPDGLFKEPPLPPVSGHKHVRSSTPGEVTATSNGDMRTSPSAKRKSTGDRRLSSEQRKKPDVKEVEVEGIKEVHVTLSPHSPARDPPEPSELIQALEELENSPSSDVAAREKIASLPPEVSDVTLLDRLKDRPAGLRLLGQVSDAMSLLTEYNGRLSGEMEERKRVARMLQDFTQGQKDLLTQAERTLEEYQVKLEKVYLLREELKSHIQNLPDISKLPTVTGAAAVLPSAGDLFS